MCGRGLYPDKYCSNPGLAWFAVFAPSLLGVRVPTGNFNPWLSLCWGRSQIAIAVSAPANGGGGLGMCVGIWDE